MNKPSVFLIILILLMSHPLQAEITLDGSLGASGAVTGPDYQIGAELGSQQGSNLFHSFGQFNINTAETATFSGPEQITNVISRVTGGQASLIDGTLRSTMPKAEVYLLNPAGLMFGSNAVLDIPGAFHASTADKLRFQDGTEFNAKTPTASGLTVAPIAAFGFLSNSPASLTIQGNPDFKTSGQALSLIGGNIQIQQSSVKAGGGRINIASVSAPGEVIPQPADLILTAPPGDITVADAKIISSGGNLYIRSRQLALTNSSLQNNVGSKSDLDGGEINIQTDSLSIYKGGLQSVTLGDKNAGSIRVKTQGTVEVNGATMMSANSEKGKGNAGTIEIESGNLILKEGAIISTTTFGAGEGGNITLRIKDAINLSGTDPTKKQGSAIAANTRGENNGGAGGTITVETSNLTLADGATMTAGSLGSGAGGNIHLQVADTTSLTGEDQRGISSRIAAVTAISGQGGAITLHSRQLFLQNGSMIRADSGGSGSGGNINLQVSDLVRLADTDSSGYGSLISANASGKQEGAGNGGTIMLVTSKLHLADGGQIGTSSFGPGQGGKIEVNAEKEAVFTGMDKNGTYASGLFSSSEATTAPAGTGGSVVITAGRLVLTNQAQLSARTKGPGPGGNVKVQANTMFLANNAKITARSEALGDAGQIEINLNGGSLFMKNASIQTSAQNADGGNLVLISPRYVYLIGSQISTSVSEEFGGGGNITLNPQFVVVDGSQVFAKAKKGRGGNIDITTTGVYNFTGEVITKIINASSEMGVDGVVTISTPDQSADEGLLVLSTNLLDVSGLMKTPCSQQVAENISSFLMVDHEGAPTATNDLQPSGVFFSKKFLADASSGKKVTRSLQIASTHPTHPMVVLMTECKNKRPKTS